MSTTRITPHISSKFDQDLEDIRARVLTMGGLVQEHLGKVMQALSKGDVELAEYVASNDFQVDTMELEIDAECTQILVKRQPAASDLRLVMAVTKTITDIERIGDEVEKIGRLVWRSITEDTPKSYYFSVLTMGKDVLTMLQAALDAFARMDSRAAVETAVEDPKIDRQYDAILRQLITYMMEDPRSITRVLDAIWIVRALERIGDHTKNICENIIYLVEGKDVRHLNIERLGESADTIKP